MIGSNYIYSIIGVEILSILICLILLYGNIFERHDNTPRNRLFSYAIAACMLALAADAASWIFDGSESMIPLLYVTTIISVIMTFVIDAIFIYFITAYTRERRPVSPTLPRVFMVFVIIVVIAIAASAKSGALFYFENGVYRTGDFYTIYLVLNLLCSIFCLCTNIYYMRFLSLHDRIASMSYIIFPWIVGVINLFHESFSYAYPSITLSLVMLYVMIQSERQTKLQMEGSISYYHARRDVLTDLFNRMAYEERVQQIAASEGFSGAVFTDVNGLKYANDHIGHEAGDKLLIRYAELMCRIFRKDDIFRISGDEFVILLDNANADEDALRSRVDTFREALNEDDVPMASVGFACGDSKDINALIRIAESKMYIEKKEFHREHPELERR